ncbi:4Fe-4S ferredoxin [Candidatus Atribacteria bacterium HGW-Atribacteria-1]|nr:MAG: 4Fe-4S ferredoxin [Candidatus Atribacteria bacterium HGW-Atribacteria-1]
MEENKSVIKKEEKTQPQKAKMISLYIMGKKYEVPEGSTIMGALEYAGYQLKRGCGCREGFCGACATVYRTTDDYKIKTGLACQTVVEPNMYLAQIPFFPANKALYDLNELEPSISTFQEVYPETFRCVSCNTCTKACPQDLEVMDYIQALIRGDIAKAADLSFDCIMCGLCAARCPAEIVQYNVAVLARRLYGKYLSKKGEYLESRLKEIKEHKYDKEIEEFMHMDRESIKKKYYARDIERM